MRYLLNIFFILIAPLFGDSAIKEMKGVYMLLEDENIIQIDFLNSWYTYLWKVGERLKIEEGEDECYITNLDTTYHNVAYGRLGPFRKSIPYRQFIKDISPNGREITLESGLIFYFTWAPWQTENLETDWEIGDEITLKYNYSTSSDYGPHLYIELGNVAKFSFKEMGIHLKNTTWNCPTLLATEDRGYTIELSDGSKWKLYSNRVSRHWQIGDKIAIFPSADITSSWFVLINQRFNNPYRNPCSYATIIP